MKLNKLAGLSLGIFVAGCGAGAGAGAPEAAATPNAGAGAAVAPVAARPVHSDAERARIRDFLDKRIDRRTIRKTLRTAGGRQVHCIDINSQPALNGGPVASPPIEIDPDRTALKQGTIQPEALWDVATGAEARCDAGTVPVREILQEDLDRYESLDEYFKKTPSHIGTSESPYKKVEEQKGPVSDLVITPLPIPIHLIHYGPVGGHQYAHAYRSVLNYGAETNINIWSPRVELSNEFSLEQIWVTAGSYSDNSLQTLEVGVQHYHDLYGDDNTHLFIYSTRDAYQNKVNPGCYNNSCGDFVQVSSTWHPGTTWFNSSTTNGQLQAINAHWMKAGETGDWWLSVHGEWVGYYPRSKYNAAANHATNIDFGGEIVDNRNGGRHTTTQMGSGAFAAAGFANASYMNQIRYNDSNPSGNAVTWAEANGLTPSQDDANCYSISYVQSTDPNWHNYFFFGGPGYDFYNCH